MSLTARLRLLYGVEAVAVIAALVAGAMPAVLALYILMPMNEHPALTFSTFSRVQLVLSMLTGLPALVMVVFGAVASGHPKPARAAFNLQVALGMLLFSPTLVSALMHIGEEPAQLTLISVTWPVGVALLSMPVPLLAALLLSRRQEEPGRLAWALALASVTLLAIFNLLVGFAAFGEIGTWV